MAVIWKVRPTPSRQTARGLQPDDVAAVQPHDAGVGRELAVQHVEAGALARAVGADQRQKLAGIDGERDVGHGLHAAERLVQPFDLEDRRHARGLAPATGRAPCRPPTRPCGNSSTISRITAPSTARQNSVRRATSSRSQVKIAAPTTGPVERLDTAQQHHDQPVGRLGDGDGRGRDAALGEGIDGAGQARRHARQHEGRPLEAAHVDADRLGAQRRIAAGAQGVAEGREQHAPQERDAGAAEDERQVVVDRLAGEPGRRPDAEQAVAAAGEGIPLEHDRPADLREGQRQHGEIDAGQAHAEPAIDHGEGAGGERRQDERRFHRQAEALQSQAGAHRRRGRNRRRGRTTPCRPGP